MKKILVFRKDGLLRFVGHLDVMRSFQRAMARAGLTPAYSQGFNPHPLMSFASPLSLGYTGENEVMEVILEGEPSDAEVMENLSAQLPAGLTLLSVRTGVGSKGNAMSKFAAADFEIRSRILEGNEQNVRDFFAKDEILSEKLGKVRGHKRTVEVDLKPLIFGWHQEGESLFVRGAGGAEVNFNPELLCNCLFAELGNEDASKSIIRKGLLFRKGEEFFPLQDCEEL